MYKKITACLSVGAALALLAGCATSPDAGAVKKAQATADEALVTANKAMEVAKQARTTAEGVAGTAADAKAMAERALTDVETVNEKSERMFKKAMGK